MFASFQRTAATIGCAGRARRPDRRRAGETRRPAGAAHPRAAGSARRTVRRARRPPTPPPVRSPPQHHRVLVDPSQLMPLIAQVRQIRAREPDVLVPFRSHQEPRMRAGFGRHDPRIRSKKARQVKAKIADRALDDGVGSRADHQMHRNAHGDIPPDARPTVFGCP